MVKLLASDWGLRSDYSPDLARREARGFPWGTGTQTILLFVMSAPDKAGEPEPASPTWGPPVDTGRRAREQGCREIPTVMFTSWLHSALVLCASFRRRPAPGCRVSPCHRKGVSGLSETWGRSSWWWFLRRLSCLLTHSRVIVSADCYPWWESGAPFGLSKEVTGSSVPTLEHAVMGSQARAAAPGTLTGRCH